MNTNRKVGTLLFIEDKNMNVKAFLSKKFNNPTVAVVICDDEIKVGDKGLHLRSGEIRECISDEEYDTSANATFRKRTSELFFTYQARVNHKKVLVLPDQFSQEFLQAIVDGKIKENDKVEVEIEYIE